MSAATVSGLIAAINETAGREVVLAYKEWPRRPRPIKRGLFGRIWAAIRNLPTYEVRPEPMVVEVALSESVTTSTLADIEETVNGVRPLGVRVDLEHWNRP